MYKGDLLRERKGECVLNERRSTSLLIKKKEIENVDVLV